MELNIEPTETIGLIAATHPWLTETWHFSNTPRWHAKFSGLTPVKEAPLRFAKTTWHPWPEEQVSISLTKPNATKGPSTTIEAVEVIHSPGERSSDVTLKLQLLSSVGGDFVVPAPPDATLKTYTNRWSSSHSERREQKNCFATPPWVAER